MIAEAEEYSQRVFAKADAHLEAATQQAAALVAEANLMVERARERARVESEQARSQAARLTGEAYSRASALSAEAEEMLTAVVADAEAQLADLRRQQTGLTEYLRRVQVIGNGLGRVDREETVSGDPDTGLGAPLRLIELRPQRELPSELER